MDNAEKREATTATGSAQNAGNPELLVIMEGIEKRFPGVHAISNGQFDLRAGEVHALLGENGAGKSTLMKVLAGVYTKDAGRIIYKGREVEIPHPESGAAAWHQYNPPGT